SRCLMARMNSLPVTWCPRSARPDRSESALAAKRSQVDREAVDPLVDLRALLAERLGDGGDAPAVALEQVDQPGAQLLVLGVEVCEQGWRARGASQLRGKMREPDDVAVGQRASGLQRLLELADVVRPVVAKQGAKRGRLESQRAIGDARTERR